VNDESVELLAVRSGATGFDVRTSGDQVTMWSVSPQGGGWRVAGQAPAPLSLERADRTGFVLRCAAGHERARTMPLCGAADGGTRCLLLEDARLYRIVRRAPGEDGFDLESWEVPGAYARAVLEAGAWRLRLEPAGIGLAQTPVLMLMLAAEALDAERRLQTENA
jgi:hypothetical protein